MDEPRTAGKVVKIRSLPSEALDWDDYRLSVTAWAYWLGLGKRLQDPKAPQPATEFNESVRQAIVAIDARTDDPGLISIARALRLTSEERFYEAAVLWRQIVEDGMFVEYLKRMAKEVVGQRRKVAEEKSKSAPTDKASRSSHFLQEVAASVRRGLSKHGKPLTKTTFMSEMIAALGTRRKAFEKGEKVNWPWVSADGHSQPCPRNALFELVDGVFPRDRETALAEDA
jgi:hypothetical protein